MGKISLAARNALLNHIFNDAYTMPGDTPWIGLSTTDPATAVTEPGAYGYARVPIIFDAPVTASRQIVQQDAPISFPEVTAGGDWGQILYYTIHSTQTSGTLLAYGAFSSAFNPVAGNTPTIPPAAVSITIDSTSTGAGFTNIAVNHMLNMLFRNIAWTQPDVYLGLTATAGGEISDLSTLASVTEIAGSGYSRKNFILWAAASGGSIVNTGIISMGSPTADDWPEFNSLMLCSAASTGELLAYDNANVADQTPKTVDTIQVATGGATFTLS